MWQKKFEFCCLYLTKSYFPDFEDQLCENLDVKKYIYDVLRTFLNSIWDNSELVAMDLPFVEIGEILILTPPVSELA